MVNRKTSNMSRLLVYRMYKTEASTRLFLIGILALSCLSTSIFKRQDQALAQQYVQTTKSRNLAIDLGNGLKTNAQLTYPAIGKGPFPGILLFQGSGAFDKNGTDTMVLKNGPKPHTPYLQIAQYLSERGFAVLRYDKRGAGTNYTNFNQNVWGNATINDFIHDAEKALNVLVQQPEVDPKRISLIGHSEGTLIAPRVAIDNPTKVKNIVLMATVAQNMRDIASHQYVNLPLEYATQVLDKNHTGFILIKQMAKDPLMVNLLVPSSVLITFLRTHDTKVISNALVNKFGNNTIQDSHISIDKQLKPLLIKEYENLTASNPSKCNDFGGCPVMFRSYFDLIPTLSIIGNVSKSIGILLLNGENDSQTPMQQAFLLQQRLTDVQHPDHTLITYPNLGHEFYPSSQWLTRAGPIEPYVLADIYTWLEAHSGFSNSNIAPTVTASITGTNTNSSKR
jgi:uncharacterized protein